MTQPIIQGKVLEGDADVVEPVLRPEPFSVSVAFSIGPRDVESVALMAGIPVHEVSEYLDKHLERGKE